MNYMEGLRLITAVELVAPTSDENVTVTDTEFSGVPVRLFLPRRAPGGLRRAVVYFHGGGWCLGDAGELCPGLCQRPQHPVKRCLVFGGSCHREGQGAGVSPAESRGKSAESAAQRSRQLWVCVPSHRHWALIPGMHGYDLMSRRISNEINAVVVSVK